ncbi:Light-sensor Protein kinase [Ceratobasidium sp. 395]|nr:Light-sensor Protein kinase [Ceratobasidium sp. 395]
MGDLKKIRTVVSNLTANAVKYTETGQITVECRRFKEPIGLRGSNEVVVEIIVADTGRGISGTKLESIFREFEQVESSDLGLRSSLASLSNLVGSQFSLLIPFALTSGSSSERSLSPNSTNPDSHSRTSSVGFVYASTTSASIQSTNIRIDDMIVAISAPTSRIGSASPSRDEPRSSSSHMKRPSSGSIPQTPSIRTRQANTPPAIFKVEGSRYLVCGVKPDESDTDRAPTSPPSQALVLEQAANRVLKQLEHPEAVQKVETDREWDCVLMDIQMPILDGFGETKAIRGLESADQAKNPARTIPTDCVSMRLNGRIPIFAVSASLLEDQREKMHDLGMDGWILKPIAFDRLWSIIRGITDLEQRQRDKYQPGKWEIGGWLGEPNPNT